MHVIDSLLLPTINDLIESGPSDPPTTTAPPTTTTTVESTTSTTGVSTTSTTGVSPTPTTGVSTTPTTGVSPTPTTGVSPVFADPPSPASGHAEVVAQGLVAFSGGEYHWAVTTATATAGASALGTTGPVFVLADGPGGVLVGPSGEPPAWRLAPGEAVFDDVPLDARSVATVDGALILISPVPGSGTNPFTPGEGLRDVDLIRDVLSTNEALVLRSDVSVLVIVTEGAVTTGGTTIAAGSPVALSGDITLINLAPEPAVVVAAVIGPLAGRIRSRLLEALTENIPSAASGPYSGPTTTAPMRRIGDPSKRSIPAMKFCACIPKRWTWIGVSRRVRRLFR